MDNTEPKLSKEQQQYKEEQLARGGAFDQMVKSDGFKYMKAFYENSLKQFVNEIFTSDKALAEYENQRQQIIGLRKLLTEIDFSIKNLHDNAKKTK